MRIFPAILLITSLLIAGCDDDGDEDLYVPDPLIEIENKFEIDTLWSNDIGEGVGENAVKMAPVFAYDKIYVADSFGKLAAINADNGDTLWEFDYDIPIAGGPVVANKIVAVGTRQGEVVVFDAETGELKWRVQLSSEIISSPAIGEGHIAVRTIDGKIYALDAVSGEQKWFYDESIPPLTLRGNSNPIIINGGVIAGFSNGKLAVFILSNGQLAWEKKIAIPIGSSEIQRLVDVDLTPLVVGSSIYIGSYNGNLASLNFRNGEFNWQRELSTFQDMAVSDLLLFVTHEDSNFSAVNRTNGVIIWTQKDLHRRLLTAPALAEKHVLVGDYEGYIHWLSIKTGMIESRELIDSTGFVATPLVLEDKIIVYSRGGSLYAIKKETP